MTRAGASDAPLGLMIVDLDEFRTVNDIWGHAVADEVLQASRRQAARLCRRPGQPRPHFRRHVRADRGSRRRYARAPPARRQDPHRARRPLRRGGQLDHRRGHDRRGDLPGQCGERRSPVPRRRYGAFQGEDRRAQRARLLRPGDGEAHAAAGGAGARPAAGARARRVRPLLPAPDGARFGPRARLRGAGAVGAAGRGHPGAARLPFGRRRYRPDPAARRLGAAQGMPRRRRHGWTAARSA